MIDSDKEVVYKLTCSVSISLLVIVVLLTGIFTFLITGIVPGSYSLAAMAFLLLLFIIQVGESMASVSRWKNDSVLKVKDSNNGNV